MKTEELAAGFHAAYSAALAHLRTVRPQTTYEEAAQWYRLNTFYWIENERGQKVKFRMTPIQQRAFFAKHTRNVVPKARQIRLSTLVAMLMLDCALFTPNQTYGIIDITDEDAKRKLNRIRFAYEHLDDKDDPATWQIGALIKQGISIVADNAHEIEFSNETKIWASTTMRGAAVTFLWVTEFGPIAADFPDKAEKIMSGAFNAIHAGAVAWVESTYRGGRFGKFYDLIRLAQKSPMRPNALQWKLQFYGWQDEPTYAVPPHGPFVLSGRLVEYFEALEKEWGRKLTAEQKHWYALKSAEQGDSMATEFPGTLEEALRGKVEGAIYGDIIVSLRAQGRIASVVPDGESPLLTFWDIGMSDLTAVWLVQMVGFDIHALDYHTGNGMTPAQHAAQMARWEREYKQPIARHYLPHDANHRGQSGETYVDLLKLAGLRNIMVVPVTPDVWVGINKLRAMLPRFRFNAQACEREVEIDGKRWPSGLGAIEGYKRKTELSGGRVVELPVHDQCSHGASALRVLAEAHGRGMLADIASLRPVAGRAMGRPVRQLSGIAEPDVLHAQRRRPARQLA